MPDVLCGNNGYACRRTEPGNSATKGLTSRERHGTIGMKYMKPIGGPVHQDDRGGVFALSHVVIR